MPELNLDSKMDNIKKDFCILRNIRCFALSEKQHPQKLRKINSNIICKYIIFMKIKDLCITTDLFFKFVLSLSRKASQDSVIPSSYEIHENHKKWPST